MTAPTTAPPAATATRAHVVRQAAQERWPDTAFTVEHNTLTWTDGPTSAAVAAHLHPTTQPTPEPATETTTADAAADLEAPDVELIRLHSCHLICLDALLRHRADLLVLHPAAHGPTRYPADLATHLDPGTATGRDRDDALMLTTLAGLDPHTAPDISTWDDVTAALSHTVEQWATLLTAART